MDIGVLVVVPCVDDPLAVVGIGAAAGVPIRGARDNRGLANETALCAGAGHTADRPPGACTFGAEHVKNSVRVRVALDQPDDIVAVVLQSGAKLVAAVRPGGPERMIL